MSPIGSWRNRITGSGIIKVSEAKPHALNFRLHPAAQSQALAASLDNVGWVQQVVINTTTGNLLDGHLRVDLARQRGEVELPCLFVELSEDEERLVLASLDPIAAMADGRPRRSSGAAGLDSERGRAGPRPARVDRPPGAHRAADGSAGLLDPDERARAPGRARLKARRPLAPGRTQARLWRLHDPATCERLMAGERAVPMVCRPAVPDRLPTPTTTRRATPTGPRPRTSTGTTTSTTTHSVAFYESLPAGCPGGALWARRRSSTSGSA